MRYSLAALTCFASLAHARAITSWNFDWDDNVFYMPTKIELWDAKRQVEVPISPEEFAVASTELGKPGRWQRFSLRQESVRRFEDPKVGASPFPIDVIRGLTEPENGWQGPSWKDFQKATETPAAAEWTTIITARGHAPKVILRALQELKKRGFIKALPRVEHIYPVSYTGMPETLRATPPGNIAPAKAAVMTTLLDKIEKIPVGPGERHIWNFSDDDWNNITKAREVLEPEVAKNRWPHVKITLSYTGRNHPTEAPHSIILSK